MLNASTEFGRVVLKLLM